MKTNVYTIGQVPSTPRGDRCWLYRHRELRVPAQARRTTRCTCGFRIRGEHHNDGGHHKGQKFGN